ncbi:MAG: ABC transporter permease [Deltaproteobacteria bacterium]|nr:ABC transporter permease [Deltaproteobacteria bacterium]
MNVFERFVGVRYLKARKRHRWLNVTTWISVSGVAVGVMALVVVLSVMNGFGNDLKSKILAFRSHILIQGPNFEPMTVPSDFAQSLRLHHENIEEVMPYLEREMIVKSKNLSSGVIYKGIPESKIHWERMDSSRRPKILLGRELAVALNASLGDEIEIISPLETTGPLGTLPKMKKYTLAGFIETGVYEYDTKLAYVTLAEAQRFLEYESNQVDGFELWLSDIHQVSAVAKALSSLPQDIPHRVRSFQELNRALFDALRLEKLAMFVILSFVILVAALNMITTLTRLVLEKKKEVAILKTMGAQNKHVLMIFLFQGLWIGLIGLIVGLLGSAVVLWGLNTFELIRLPEIYYNTTVPIDVDWIHVVGVSALAFFVTLLSSLYPAYQASRLHPLEGILN